MRNSRAFVAAGTVRVNALGMRHAVVTIAVLVAALWVGVAFAQEAYLGHKLSQQVSDLRRQNAVLAAQNAGYHKDIQALESGAANEEEARLNGYAKPWEKLYLVSAAPSPTPQASPSPSPSP
ncbi:MAG TPA: hypothetical protein VGK42_07105 [Candidatus Dormibacteraeota bacterium]|jgi:cell division protein FtsB